MRGKVYLRNWNQLKSILLLTKEKIFMAEKNSTYELHNSNKNFIILKKLWSQRRKW